MSSPTAERYLPGDRRPAARQAAREGLSCASRANTSCSTNDMAMTAATFNPANLPSLSYVVPNQCDDMHTLPDSGQACPSYFGSNPGTTRRLARGPGPHHR